MLYDGGGKGVWHCPCTIIIAGGVGGKYYPPMYHPQIFRFEVLKPWVNMKSCV